MHFILASTSPRRLELLAQLGITPARIIPADIDETPFRDELPSVYVRRMARGKAQRVMQDQPGDIILAADTVVTVGRRILPKAANEAAVRACLALISGRRHTVLSAVCVIDAEGREWERRVATQVRVKRLSVQEIDAYIMSGEGIGKAGGYAIQGRFAAYAPEVFGSYSNVVGLPLYETAQLLAQANSSKLHNS